jgi:hypothetical protein
MFIQKDSIRYPAIIGRISGGPLKLLLDSQDLNKVSKDHEAFLKSLLSSAEQNDISLEIKDNAKAPSSL